MVRSIFLATLAGSLCAACGPPGRVIVSAPLKAEQLEADVHWRVWDKTEDVVKGQLTLVNAGEGTAYLTGLRQLDGESVGRPEEGGATPRFYVSFPPNPPDPEIDPGGSVTIGFSLSTLPVRPNTSIRASVALDFANAPSVTVHLEAETFTVECPQLPMTIDFGTVEVGTLARQVIALNNTSDEVIAPALFFEKFPTTDVSELGIDNPAIPPGERGGVSFSFAPSTAYEVDATFRMFAKFCPDGTISVRGTAR